MRVVQLDRDLFREELPFTVVELLEATDNVLQGSGTEEVLLTETENLTIYGGVVRIKDLRNRFGEFHILHSGEVVTVVEVSEAEFVGALGAPKAEVVHRVVAVARNRRIVRESDHVVLRFPTVAELALFIGPRNHITAERNADRVCRACDFPRVRKTEPVIRKFFLLAVLDLLVEHTVFVTDAHTHSREFERCHGVEEAGSQTAETTVTEASIHFFFAEFVESHADFIDRFFHSLFHIEVQHGVTERTTDQKFEGKIIDALDVFFVVGFLGLDPTVNQAVTNGVSDCQKLFMLGHRVFVTGKRMMNMIVKSLFESFYGVFQNFVFRLGLFFFCHVSAL